LYRTRSTHYGLTTLHAEFFLNTRDVPMSFDSALESRGDPVFSVEKSVGSLDILYPDPIDLSGVLRRGRGPNGTETSTGYSTMYST